MRPRRLLGQLQEEKTLEWPNVGLVVVAVVVATGEDSEQIEARPSSSLSDSWFMEDVPRKMPLTGSKLSVEDFCGDIEVQGACG